jgi:LacI family transcriptional regulator
MSEQSDGRDRRPGDATGPITIEDVAVRAGVSTATVSRLLSGVSKGRPRTRERVLQAAKELDYRPSGVARSLKLRTTHTLGLLITDIQNPFFPELVRAIEDRARDMGYALLLGNGAEDQEREAAYLELLASRRVDGILIAASSLTERHARWLARPPVPTVLVNCEVADGSLSAALSDNRDGGRLSAEHLLGLGHRAVGLLTVRDDDPAASERAQGVRDAFEAHGLDPAGITVGRGHSYVAGGEAAMRQVLLGGPGITAAVCYNDMMAIGALRALRAAGRRVPDDVSVIGFDDIDIAAYAEPPLTTIAQDTTALGRWAVERLLDTIGAAAEGRAPPRVEVRRLPVTLVVRATTAPVAAGAVALP